MKIVFRVFAALFCVIGLKLNAGNLKINLAPSQAVTAGAQWRVDNGTWRNSGTTVSGLSNGNHAVDFKAVSGWITPAAQSVAVASGTTTITATYLQPAALKITLTPSSGQWRIDSGAWRTSATTVTGLTPGNHTVDYAAVSGYAAPAAETIALIAGQTTTLARSYTQLAQVKVTLSPATGQWRVDSGTWQASGATVSNLAVGSHSITYSALSGYASPITESVTLASGQLLTLNRSYVQLARFSISLTPASAQWRIDGGAWQASGATVANLAIGSHAVDYAALTGYNAPPSESISLTAGQSLTINRSYIQLARLTVTLSPSSAQWRVDGGAWNASGATVLSLTPGAHQVSYSSLTGWGSPADEVVTLTAGQVFSFSRSYTQLAQLSFTLVPSSGQWRANGGAWQASGASLLVLPGSYSIEYLALSLYDSPAIETVTLAAGGIFSTIRNYTSQKPALRINLGPAGQWRIDGGAWQNSGVQLTDLNAGSHTLDYADIGGIYDVLPAETISLALRDNVTLTRTYPFKPASLQVNLTPATGTWRAYQNEYSSGWQPSGATITGLRYSNYNIEYSQVPNYYALATENVAISPAQSLTLDRSYVPRAQITINLDNPSGQWSIDGGPWQSSGATVKNLGAGLHPVSYAPVAGYTAPPDETLEITESQSFTIDRSYTPNPAQLSITLNLPGASWRIDAGPWQASGAVLSNINPGPHMVDYSDVAGYSSPPIESMPLSPGQSLTLTRDYAPIPPATVTITIDPPSAQWNLNNGPWQTSGATQANVPAGTYSIYYLPVPGYITPPNGLISVTSGQALSLTRRYTRITSLTITLSQTSGQWRVDGGTWRNSGSSYSGISVGTHNVEYSTVNLYATPPAETIAVASEDQIAFTRTYTPLTQISMLLSHVSGQWRIDGGAWLPSGFAITNAGSHTIDFKPVAGYITPPSQTVTVIQDQTLQLSVTYDQLPQLTLTLHPDTAQWRVDGGVWLASGVTVSNLSVGTHAIDYSTIPHFAAPASNTYTLVGGQSLTVNRFYNPLSSLTVTISYPSTAQWRVDGGAWRASGTTASDLTFDTPHLVEYLPVSNYETPAAETFTLASGQAFTATRFYTPLSQMTLTLYPATAQWRVDGGAWQASGATVSSLSFGTPHTVDYSTADGFVAPPSETFTLVSGQTFSAYRYYNQLSKLTLTLYPNTAQWRIDGGAWQASGVTVSNLSFGTPHLVEFSTVTGYTPPPSETVTLFSGQAATAYRYYTTTTQIHAILNPANAQWRVDGGAWQNSGASVYDLTSGYHTIDYSAVDGYVTPPSETPQLFTSQVLEVFRSYTPAAKLQVTLNPAQAQWSIDQGLWQPSGATVSGIYPGYHRIDYKDVLAYTAPSFEMVNLPGGQLTSLSRNYTATALLTIKTLPSNTRWRVNGGQWWLNDMTYTGSQSGNVTVEYETPATYQPIPAETVTLTAGTVVSLTRSSPTLTAPEAGQLIVHANPGLVLTRGFPQFAVDLGSYNYAGWYFCEQSVSLPAGTHYLLFAQGVPGWQEPAPVMVNITAGTTTEITVNYRYVHHLKFYLNANLTAGLDPTEIERRLNQYVAHLNLIFGRESLRTFVFQSYYDLNVAASDPFTSTPPNPLPVYNFPLSIYASLTDNPAVGTYGGRPAVDAAGGGGGTDFKWDQIYDPATLADGSPQLEQYWRQLHHIVRVLELSFGAGAGEYSSLAGMKDASGVAPVLDDTAAADSAVSDTFWNGRLEYWGDPLTANAWANPRIGSPTSLTTLVNAVSFAPVSESLINGSYRSAEAQSTTLPDMSSIVVKTVDSVTGQPIATSTVRVWNRSSPTAPFDSYEETVTNGSSTGTFTFAWTGVPLANSANAKLIKASAPGYTSTATWVTTYDAQKAKIVEGKAVLEITLVLTPQ